MAWVFPDETTEPITSLFSQIEQFGAWVPALWEVEVANVLQTAVRKKRCTTAFRDRALASLAILPIERERPRTERIWVEAVRRAERHILTVYDAVYLELAVRRGLPLATLDEDLRKAAVQEGVFLLGR